MFRLLIPLICISLFHFSSFALYDKLIQAIHKKAGISDPPDQSETDCPENENSKHVTFSFDKPRQTITITRSLFLQNFAEFGRPNGSRMEIIALKEVHPLTLLMYLMIRQGDTISFNNLPENEIPNAQEQVAIVIGIFKFLEMMGTVPDDSQEMIKIVAQFVVEKVKSEEVEWKSIQKLARRGKIPQALWAAVFPEALPALGEVEDNKANRVLKEKAQAICNDIKSREFDFGEKLAALAKQHKEARIVYLSSYEQNAKRELIWQEACELFNDEENQALFLKIVDLEKDDFSYCRYIGEVCLHNMFGILCCPYITWVACNEGCDYKWCPDKRFYTDQINGKALIIEAQASEMVERKEI